MIITTIIILMVSIILMLMFIVVIIVLMLSLMVTLILNITTMYLTGTRWSNSKDFEANILNIAGLLNNYRKYSEIPNTINKHRNISMCYYT